MSELLSFPAYQLLVVEERLSEQEAEGVEMPAAIQRDERALRIMIAAGTRQVPPTWGTDLPSPHLGD